MRISILLIATAIGLVVAKTPYQQRQAKRADIVERAAWPRLRPRGSTLPCSTKVYDKAGACCSTATLDKNQVCCSTTILDKTDNCCASGATTQESHECCPASRIYKVCDGNNCCDLGSTAYNTRVGQTANACCPGTPFQTGPTTNDCCQDNLYTVPGSTSQICCSSSANIVGSGTAADPYVCCQYNVYTDTSGVKRCCAPGFNVAASSPSGPLDTCCYGASTYYIGGSPTKPTCCGPQRVPRPAVAGTLPSTCCDSTQIASGTECVAYVPPVVRRSVVPLAEPPTKRYIHVDEDVVAGSSMMKRHDSKRTVLSAKLVADHLSNGGVFYHNDERFIDKTHAHQHDSLFQKVLTFGLNSAAKYAIDVGKYAAPHLLSEEYFAMSPEYEFAVQDVPEIAARLLGNASFEHFFYGGRRFDRSLVHDLASHHPNFDAEFGEHLQRFKK